MAGKQVTELDALPSFTDASLVPVHNGAGLKKGTLTQLSNYMGNKFSNPNLLINPDFKINQRGKTSYTGNEYTVDRWKGYLVTVTPTTSGINIKSNSSSMTGTLVQKLETATEGATTLSCYVTSVSGSVSMGTNDADYVNLKQGLNTVHTTASTSEVIIRVPVGASVTIKWVKLEQGSVATEFVAPIKADELTRCQRYYEKPEVLIGRIIINTSQNFNTSYTSKYYRILNGSFKVEKRVVPTITIKGALSNINGGAIGASASEFKSDTKALRQCTMSSAINVVDINISNVEIDAEIY